jgi:hypothetical protein
LDPEIPAKYHPFYITDDPVGGYGYKTAEEREVIFKHKYINTAPRYDILYSKYLL